MKKVSFILKRTFSVALLISLLSLLISIGINITGIIAGTSAASDVILPYTILSLIIWKTGEFVEPDWFNVR